MARAFQFDVGPVVEQLNRILQMELAAIIYYTHYSFMIYGHARIPITAWLRDNGMPLAGIPLRSDRPQPALSHQPPDAPAAHRNPLSQQRHLEPAAAVDWTVCENPVEPLQKLEFLRRFRPRPVIEAAARNPQQRALPAYGQPRFRRNHRPPRRNREMAGCPARKSRSTCSWPILRCRSSMTFCASPTAGALLPRANSSPARFTSSCFQSLIIVG